MGQNHLSPMHVSRGPQSSSRPGLGGQETPHPKDRAFRGHFSAPTRAQQERAQVTGSDCDTLTWVHSHHQTQWPKPGDLWAQVLGARTPVPPASIVEQDENGFLGAASTCTACREAASCSC